MLVREVNRVGKQTMLSVLLGGDVVITPTAISNSRLGWKEEYENKTMAEAMIGKVIQDSELSEEKRRARIV
jgi:hypothetical protein